MAPTWRNDATPLPVSHEAVEGRFFIGNSGANDFQKSTHNELSGKNLISENGTREGWDMVITILSRSSVHYINSRKGTIFYPKLARASKVSLVESSSKMHIFQSRKISRGGKDIPCWVIDRSFTAAFSTFTSSRCDVTMFLVCVILKKYVSIGWDTMTHP